MEHGLPCGVASNCKVHFHANRSSAVGVALAFYILFLPTALSLEVDNTQADSLSFVLPRLSQLSDVVTLLFLFCFGFFSCLCWAIKRAWKWMNHILVEIIKQVCTALMSMAGMILAEVKGVWMTITGNWKSHLRPVWYPVKSCYSQFLTFWTRILKRTHTKLYLFSQWSSSNPNEMGYVRAKSV